MTEDPEEDWHISAEPKVLTDTRTPVPGGVMYARTKAPVAAPVAPVIVLVHGMVISSSYMVPTAERLAPLSRVYAIVGGHTCVVV